MKKKISRCLLLFLVTILPTLSFGPALAQDLILQTEIKTISASPAAEQDNNVGAEILNVNEPDILPDSGFYFIKEWGRGLSNVFTFSEEGKAEKRLNQASDRLAEIQVMIKNAKGSDLTIEAIKKYQNDIAVAQEKLEIVNQGGQNYSQLMETATAKYMAFAKVLAPTEDLSLAISSEITKEIYNSKKIILDDLAKSLEKLEAPEEKIAEILTSQPGSDFKDFKNLEILSELKTKLPEQAAQAITNAQEKIKEQIIDKFNNSTEGKAREEFANYVIALKGSEADHIAILNELAKNTSLPDEVVYGFRNIKDAVAMEFSQKMINHPAAEEMMNAIASGDIDKLLVLEEMADALPPSSDVKSKLEAARSKGLDLAAKKMSEIESIDDKINFLISDGVPDAKSFIMLNEIQAKLSSDQQEKMTTVRNKAFQIFSDIVDNAENSDKLLERLAGDNPKDVGLIAIIKKNLPAGLSPKFDILAKKQLDKIEIRINEETSLEKLLEMRTEIESSPEAKELANRLSPKMNSRINQKQAERVSAAFDKAQSAEEMIKLANQYNEMLDAHPEVAEIIKKENQEMMEKTAMKQVERIKAELNGETDPEKITAALDKLRAAGMDKLQGTLSEEAEKKMKNEMSGLVKVSEKYKFLNEMKANMGENYDQTEAEKLFDTEVAKLIDGSGKPPSAKELNEIKENFAKTGAIKMAEEQKKKAITEQVQKSLQGVSGQAPSADEIVNKILSDPATSNMKSAPTQAEIDRMKAEAEAKARAEAEQQAMQDIPSAPPTSGQVPSTPPAGTQTGPTAEEIERMKQEAMQQMMPPNIPTIPTQ